MAADKLLAAGLRAVHHAVGRVYHFSQ
jgi:hypothetical protein